MQLVFASLLVCILALLQPVLSTAVLTAPVAATTGHGGKTLHLKWSDSKASPTLKSDWGNINIFLAAGGEATQYKLQQLASNVSPSTKKGSYVVDANIGPNGKYYFIRMEGTKTNSSSNIPPMAFSARFTLADMKGTFNSSVMAAAQGKEGSASSTTTSSSGSSAATGLVQSTSTSSSLSSAVTNTSSQASTTTSSAGKTQQAFVAVAGVAAAAAGLVALL